MKQFRTRIAIVAIFLLIVLPAAAQHTFFTLLNGYTSMPTCIQQTADGNYFVTAHGNQYFLMNDTGSLAWEKNLYDPNLYFDCQYNLPTPDHGFIFSGPVTDPVLGSYGYIAKLDSSGHVQWMRMTGLADDPMGYSMCSIAASPDSGYVFAAGVNVTTAASPKRGALVMKLGANGNTDWSRVIVPDTAYQPYRVQSTCIKALPGGDYIVAGLADFTLLLCRLDSAGNLRWVKTYLQDSLAGQTVYVDTVSDGGFVVSANLDLAQSNQYQACLLKTDSTGNPQWCRLYGTPGQIEIKCVRTLAGGGYAFMGMENTSPWQGAALVKTDPSGNPVWVSKFDSVFIWQTIKWSKYQFVQTSDLGFVFGGLVISQQTGQTYPCMLKTDPQGMTACRGHQVSISTQTLPVSVDTIGYEEPGESPSPFSRQEQADIITDSLICSGVFTVNTEGIEEASASPGVLLYPNPACDLLQVTAGMSCTFELYNSAGQLLQKKAAGPGTVQFDIHAYPPGLYFLVTDTGTGRTASKFIRE
ncbi:MAG TPA: T9SS type A sorting domain-containing protein [Bacteroidia bacterium]|nr:T9SS type A sorting domain-containing protein [Bacteroidia bacterium]